MRQPTMSVHNTETPNREDTGSRSKTNQAVFMIKKRGGDGSVAILVGSAVFVWALKSLRKSKAQAMLLALTGFTVLGVGRRQRRATQEEDGIEPREGIQQNEDDEKKPSDKAHVEREQDLESQQTVDESQRVYQSETEPNPRGISDRSDVQMDEEGDTDFVEEKEPGTSQKTHLEDESAHDTRLHPESDDEQTESDLSEAAMADEASEAAGPHSEQPYPAREGTDPEPTPEEAPEQINEGEPTRSQSEEYNNDEMREDDNESKETTDESKLPEEQQEAGDPSVRTADPVLVPPETSDGLKTLYEAGELDPEDRENAIEQATKRGFEKTVKWLEKVGDGVYARAARGEFVSGDER